MASHGRPLHVGLDVGSTTVKAVACDDDTILWRDYRRHETRQADTAYAMLARLQKDLLPAAGYRVFITGSGGGMLAPALGARFVQEVNAVALAVEHLHPSAGSVIELGGQDAKIIIFKSGSTGQGKKKIPSMNDKCAGGTGAVIDKIRAKLAIPETQLGDMGYTGIELHPVAAKCGVFAETDINGLQKSGVPEDQLMASLYEAIVTQNLTVLTRGNTLLPEVLLLGGPNTFLRGLQEAWHRHIPQLWEERGVELPAGTAPEALIRVPEDAQYYAALGAVEFGKTAPDTASIRNETSVTSMQQLPVSIGTRRRGAGQGLCHSPEDHHTFLKAFTTAPFQPVRFPRGATVSGFIGLDCGSTSTKAVLLDTDGEVLAAAYRLSRGNPIDDSQAVLAELQATVERDGARIDVQGVATTGYAKDVLKDAIGADIALVETVAHAHAAMHFYHDMDVICDVGGQDIKIILLKNGCIKDFRLNTQCSAGNGFFLQNTAETLGVSVQDYAETAFTANDYPEFGFGCSVFMQTDIVDFQRQGWSGPEILAGLAAVLPKNIWLYVASIPNLPALGSRFLLQGGTQKNLAAVKAQVDFIHSRFAGSGVQASVQVHRFCGESGAIGAALEARRLFQAGRSTPFIGFGGVRNIRYRVHHDERTVCHFCRNLCHRTFIDVPVGGPRGENPASGDRMVPLRADEKRIITGNSCDKGLVENVQQLRTIKKDLDAVNADNPDLAAFAAAQVWKPVRPDRVSTPRCSVLPRRWTASGTRRRPDRGQIRIGIPRVLNMYSVNPLFSGYFESLGIRPSNLVYSDFTSDELYKQGARRAAIDPCFPSKVAIAHAHNLLFGRHRKQPVDLVFFPMIDTLDSDLADCVGHAACPTITATPEVVKAALSKEDDPLGKAGVWFCNPVVNIDEPALFARQMFRVFRDRLGLTARENRQAVETGFRALADFRRTLQQRGAEVIERLEREQRPGIVVLGRPYHNDPGINHGILEQLQALGYPILTQDTLPTHGPVVEALFTGDNPQSIDDVWKNAYSENTSRKVWAAKFTARHPNLVALELSSFKCGHDAPVYTVVERIIEQSGTPYFCFKDLDENRPAASIRIRLETIDYFLRREREARRETTGADAIESGIHQIRTG